MKVYAWRCECSRGCGELGVGGDEAMVHIPVVSSSIVIKTSNQKFLWSAIS